MIGTFTKRFCSTTLSFLLVVTTTPFEAGGQQSGTQSSAPAGSTTYSGLGAPLSTDELQQLVAPIALYPDALVAQILGAATFPDQVAYAEAWLQQAGSLTGTALNEAVDVQTWDPSVKALTQFPTVLANLAKNLSWTSSLGEAYHTQPADVMYAIQVLRGKAQAAGNLKSGSQIKVVQESPQVIVIQPANPQIVYVPVYNPAVVYGYPYVTPGYSTAAVVTTGILAFGAGIAVGAIIANNSCCGWGYSYWNCNWHGGAVVYGHTTYYGNNAWHGGYYGSSVSAYGAYGSAHYSAGYNPSTGTYARGASYSNAYGTQRVGQAYNPSTGAYGATHQASNAYGNYGSSVATKNGQTAYTQHATTAQGSVGSFQSSTGAHGVAGSGYNGSGYAGQAANGDKYAGANGNQYRNTGSGWQKNDSGSWNSVQKPSSSSWGQSSADSRGWGGQDRSSGSSAWGGGNSGGWGSRSSSSRGWGSGGGGGGWGGRGGGGGFRR